MKSFVWAICVALLTTVTGVICEGQDGAVPDENCKCIPYYLCKNGAMVTDGAGIINFRSGIPKCDCQCKALIKTCCYVPNEAGIDVPGDIIEAPQSNLSRTRSPAVAQCGMQGNQPLSAKEIDSYETPASDYPWVVSVFNVENLFDQYLKSYVCSGVLIHENVAITVAHCATKINMGIKRKMSLIRAGTSSLSNMEHGEERSISQIIIHGGWNKTYVQNDIALIVTSTPFILSSAIGIICLPKANDVIVDESCTVSAWGVKENGQFRDQLEEIDLPMVPRDQCQSELRKTGLGQSFIVHESVVCAGGTIGKDTCVGSGGSPLVCPIKGKLNQYQGVGITAAGFGCGNAWPGLYVNIALFRPWIDSQMTRLGYTPSYNY